MASLLVADVGGTRSRFGVSELDGKVPCLAVEAVYKNSDFGGFEELLEHFCAEYDCSPDYACLAVAGVIGPDSAEMTNLAWRIETTSLQTRFNFKEVALINDMTALAAAVPHLQQAELMVLQSGRTSPDYDTIAVIAPGTGLGQGYFFFHDTGYIIKGSEGGHAGFSPANTEELRIADWLLQNQHMLSAETLLSGYGMTLLYRYYTEAEGCIAAAWVREKTTPGSDLAPVIVEGATAHKPCPLCCRIIARYLAMLGGESANLALKLYARGGVYLGGGVLLHLFDRVSFTPFVEAFRAKGKMAEMLAQIPVYIIQKQHANLHGVLHYAQTIFQDALP
jgi:glucokinase